MANAKNGKRTTAKSDAPADQPRDLVHPRLVWDELNRVHPNAFTDEEKSKVDAAIRDARLMYSFPKSGNGTKGELVPDKLYTVTRDETDKTKVVAMVSPVCAASASDAEMWARYWHVFVAIAAYVYNPEKPQIYTKDTFAALAKKTGLEVEDGKRAQAYGSYNKLGTYLLEKLSKATFPPVPFSEAKTNAAPIKRQFMLKAYCPDVGPASIVFVPVLNPRKTDGESPITAEGCQTHADQYDWLVFFDQEREDWKEALSYYTTEADVKASLEPPAEEEPEVDEEATGTDG